MIENDNEFTNCVDEMFDFAKNTEEMCNLIYEKIGKIRAIIGMLKRDIALHHDDPPSKVINFINYDNKRKLRAIHRNLCNQELNTRYLFMKLKEIIESKYDGQID